MSYAKTEVVWSYGTVADVLSLHYKQEAFSDFNYVPAKEFAEHISKEKALAVLEQLMDWANRYEGKHVIDNLVKKIREE